VSRHPLDAVSLVLGVVFTIAGIILLTGGEIIDEGRFLFPLGLIGLGTAVIIQATGRAHQDEDGSGPPDLGE
jgi:hypothetical protein